jgi:MATE family multidrug resistance protein
MNKRILRLAIPNVISNITVPLLGLISTRIAGGIGGDDTIAAVASGSAILSFIYWNCAFIRMGASGLTAQAYGSRNFEECANILVRSMLIAMLLAAMLLIFQRPLGHFGMRIMGNDHTYGLIGAYFFARIWAAPATVSHFAIAGWFIGMQNSRTPMVIAISINVLGAVFSWLLVSFGGMGVEGIGYGILVAQYVGLTLAWALWWRFYRRFLKYVNWRAVFDLKPLLRFFNVNKDIFIRTLCNTAVYTFFPFISRADSTMQTTNNILIQLFTLFSYIQDGLAYAAEALVGRFIGAKNRPALRESILKMLWWSAGIAVTFVCVYLVFWRDILLSFGASHKAVELAGHYIGWVMVVPLLGFAPFLMDGIFIGATRTDILRNTMLIATAIFFGVYYGFEGTLGGTALWLAFVVYIAIRGVLQLLMSQGLKGLVWFKE